MPFRSISAMLSYNRGAWRKSGERWCWVPRARWADSSCGCIPRLPAGTAKMWMCWTRSRCARAAVGIRALEVAWRATVGGGRRPMVRGAHRGDFRAQRRERAVEEELRRDHVGPGGEAGYHRGGGGRGQQPDVFGGPGGGHARPAGGSAARGHLSCDQPRRRQLVRFRARDLSHRGEEYDRAAGAVDPLSAQGEV